MKNLQSLSMKIVEESNKSSRSKSSTLDILFEILYKKESRTKEDLIPIILEKRLLEKNDQKYYDKLEDSKLQDILQKEVVTVSNSIDTSVCNGSNNSVFNYNPRFKDYELIKKDDKSFTIVDRKK